MSKRAFIAIDIQNDYFPGGRWTLKGMDVAADNAARVMAAARAEGELLVHVRHEFRTNDAPFFVAGSEGARIHEKVLPIPGEEVVLKHYVNAFRETKLEELLDRNDVGELVLMGAMSHMCVHAAGRAASDLGYGVTVIHDACATRDLEFGGVVVPAAQVHAGFMSALEFAYAKMVSTRELLGGPLGIG